MLRGIADWFQQRTKVSRTLTPIDLYNRGLEAKYEGRWQQSLDDNRLAAELDSADEAAWWNMGIAATALRDWESALFAWHKLGIQFEAERPEPLLKPIWACVRINPKNNPEVVWGIRIDPARIMIQNLPLPESGYRFRDVILNDGAPNGTRKSDGVDYPVFDELQVWHNSEYSTFEAIGHDMCYDEIQSLSARCDEVEIAFEDWSTIRILCEECSRGNLKEHICSKVTAIEGGERRLGFACTNEKQLRQILSAWLHQSTMSSISDLRLVL